MTQHGQAGLLDLQKGTYSDKGERLDWSYYDTLILKNALGAQTFRLFTQGIGQTDPTGAVKTKDLTNMKTSGIMPQNQRLVIKAIRVTYTAHAALTSLVDTMLFLNTAVLEVSINGKDASYQKPLSSIMKLAMGVQVATGAANIVLETAYAPISGCSVLRKPLVLAANVPFEVDITLAAASAAALDADRCRIDLEGLLLRAM